jgi:hypothetical protein
VDESDVRSDHSADFLVDVLLLVELHAFLLDRLEMSFVEKKSEELERGAWSRKLSNDEGTSGVRDASDSLERNGRSHAVVSIPRSPIERR